jgi:hypothetical protein
MRWVLAAAAILVLVAACGGPPTVLRPSPSAQASRLPLATLDLTDWDTGRTVQLLRGQGISGRLHQPVGYTAWSSPQNTNAAVLAPRADTPAPAPAGVTLGSFRAAGLGTAQLRATAQPVCVPGQDCPAARSWGVTIKVIRP